MKHLTKASSISFLNENNFKWH